MQKKWRKLKGHEGANAFEVIEFNPSGDVNSMELWSYSTMVIRIDVSDMLHPTIECTGLYSATTRRHISWFMENLHNGMNYYDMKAIAGKGKVPFKQAS
jgi:hypothetical protein